MSNGTETTGGGLAPAAPGDLPQPAAGGSSRNMAMLITGAVITGPSSTLIAAAHVSACTAAAYRFLYAVPPLGVVAAVEMRRLGRRGLRERAPALAAGAFLGFDLVLWGKSIADVGAGIATVISNLEIFPLSLLAWLVLRETPGRRLVMAAPVAAVGMMMLAGVAGVGINESSAVPGVAYGLGSSCCYALFLLCLRISQRGRQVVGPWLDATIGAAVATTIAGVATASLSIPPPASAEPYLIVLAFWSQTAGWLLIAYGLRGMGTARGALLLLINPVVALVVAAIALRERPSAVQLLGCLIVCIAVAAGSGVRFAGASSGSSHEVR